LLSGRGEQDSGVDRSFDELTGRLGRAQIPTADVAAQSVERFLGAQAEVFG
jgi:hypothetical protein